jgi:hypothetical protein
MAKFENELDIVAAQRSVTKVKTKLLEVFVANPELAKLSNVLSDNSAVTCYIFSKSVAFRIGKSSVKSIPGFSTGFKTSFTKGSAKAVYDPFIIPLNISKENMVVLVSAHWLLKYPDRVKSESDKTEAVESEQVVQTKDALKKLIKEYGSVRLKVGDHVYEVDDFDQVSGRPKADMVFKYKKENVVFVSHKKGSKPGDFQQYGGFSSDLGIKDRKDAAKYKAIETFLKKVDEVMEALGVKKDSQKRYDFNKLKKGSNFADLINDESVANTVMFGKDYKSGKVGLDNCSILIDGDIGFIPVKNKSLNVFELKGSYHTTVNPALLKSKKPFNLKELGIYAPAMFLIKSEQQGLNQAGYANVRAVIWPNNAVVQGYTKKFNDIYKAIKSNDKTRITQIKKELLK